ncbi:CYFA0S09e03972g1_1 [Cyberlindnera fabianii]|uniref:Nucleolar protein 12 n=1 Tax=Cyberlindnera fabianii TaxID=36022 RepID=A0A061AY36_CYBFA|nr:Nucleolar protein 12 [Cyberlindnera fabianii]CDR42456.1 CYFA0S09e03972g1_1 [Cyberlindnera fabianii]
MGIGDLFKSSKKDDSLVNLFGQKNAGPVKRSVTQRTVIELKEQKPIEKVAIEASESGSDAGSSEESGDDSQEQEAEESEEEEEQPKKKQKKTKARVEEEDDLEGRYMEKILADSKDEEEKERPTEQEEESDSDDSADESDKDVSRAGSAAKKVDLKEDEVEKAERTVFVGNLSMSVITDKKDYKSFKKLFAEHGDIDTIRFRSIAFSEPLPRKAAFVKQKVHPSRDSVNAYVVYKNKESARKALKSNAAVFLEHHLRVDSVSHPAKVDNKRSIFVGNLDFEEKEEELWNIFGGCGEIEFVRIVRDAKTNVGKGFGYVQFKDFLSVTKALMLHEKKLGEKKRKLRITRSKKIKPTSQTTTRNGRVIKTLSEDQKTKLGRAKRVLGKADRATAGQVVEEGTRAKKGDRVVGVKNGKGRVKKPRHTKRSTAFKEASKK